MQLGMGTEIYGAVVAVDGGNVAKFNFTEVNVASGCP